MAEKSNSNSNNNDRNHHQQQHRAEQMGDNRATAADGQNVVILPSLIKIDNLGANDYIKFKLEYDSRPAVKIDVRNISESAYVAFKIRTTRPNVYFVKPCSMVLAPSAIPEHAHCEMDIEIKQDECNRLIDSDDGGKHRFQVIHRKISKEDYDQSIALAKDKDSNIFQNYISQLFDKHEMQDNKRVEYAHIRIRVDLDRSLAKQQVKDVGGNVGLNRNRMLSPSNRKNMNTNNSTVSNSNSSSSNNNNNYNRNMFTGESASTIKSRLQEGAPAVDFNVSNMSHSELREQFEKLRQRFEVVVEYSVWLTADRDQKEEQLIETQKKVKKELTKKEKRQQDTQEVVAENVVHGFHFIWLVVVSIISCFAGFYLRR